MVCLQTDLNYGDVANHRRETTLAIYFQSTIHVRSAGLQKFEKTMEKLVSIVEGTGWKLIGAYVQRTGRLNTVIDLWQLDDYNHYGLGLKHLTTHSDFPAIAAVLSETIEDETVVFMDKAPYSR